MVNKKFDFRAEFIILGNSVDKRIEGNNRLDGYGQDVGLGQDRAIFDDGRLDGSGPNKKTVRHGRAVGRAGRQEATEGY